VDIVQVAAEGVQSDGLRWGVIAAVFLAGLRHGFDLDHIAAITDITSSQTDRRRSLMLASVYATGHALVLVVLGALAVLAGQRIPASVDSAMGRVIGVTLCLLGLYVVYSLVRFRRDFRLRSRWMVVLAGVRRTLMWLRRRGSEQVEIEHEHPHPQEGSHHHIHSAPTASAGSPSPASVAVRTATHVHPHKHVVMMPADPFKEYGLATSFGVGVIHGVGAETPSQILLFTTAAGLAGSIGGVFVMAAFVIGLFIGNSILAVLATMGFVGGRRLPRLYMALAGTTAIVSIYVGVLYVLGRSDLLPRALGGG
jgi:ABC-type nickel/cobalt efflux system permease component RcnA